ncbi:uncharacterized protein [Triticum aestivum]|uniref:uncharacterized protein isoform X6 n=1 Tax=Triticum aestivum TaxID=4565 RepID=UPI001D02CC7B|nr:uncharacterized protein LOC123167590 isoform X6 [Triticum aestivum]
MRASMRDALSSWPAAARAATRARGRAVAPFVQTRHRSSGKVLGEEEKAAENSSVVLCGVVPPVRSSGCSEPCCQSSSSTGPSTPTRLTWKVLWNKRYQKVKNQRVVLLLLLTFSH